MKKIVLRSLNTLALILLFISFMIEIWVCFDRTFCLTLRKTFGWSPVVVGLIVAVVGVTMLLTHAAIAKAKETRLLIMPVMIFASILALVGAIFFDRCLPRWTMRSGFDEDLFIDEYGCIAGEKLGTYALNLLTEDTPVKLYWQCSSVTSYGPIRYGDGAEELFISMDSGEVLAMSVDEYFDGTWITIKEFTLDHDMLLVFIGEEDTEILAEYLESIPHEIVNLSGKTVEEISQILEEATWHTMTWTTDNPEKEKFSD